MKVDLEGTKVSGRTIERLMAEKSQFDNERTADGEGLRREVAANREAGREAGFRWVEGGATYVAMESIAIRDDTAYPYFVRTAGSEGASGPGKERRPS